MVYGVIFMKNWKYELIEWLKLFGMIIIPTIIIIFLYQWLIPITFWQKFIMVIFIPFLWIYLVKIWIYFFDL